MAALFVKTMNSMLCGVDSHGIKWRYKFITNKSYAVCFGDGNKTKNSKITLGGSTIEFKSENGHMGIPMVSSKNQLISCISERAAQVDKTVSVISTLGRKYIPLPPTTSCKIYKSVCESKLMYGLECCSLTSKSIDILEATHYQSARRLQGLPRQVSLVVPLATLDWISIRSMLHIAQRLIHRLLTLPAMSFMRRLAIERLMYHFYDNTGKHSGPLCEFLKTCKMYKVDHFVKEMMYNPCSISHDQWCKQVKEIVYQRERDMWIVRKGMYKKRLFLIIV